MFSNTKVLRWGIDRGPLVAGFFHVSQFPCKIRNFAKKKGSVISIVSVFTDVSEKVRLYDMCEMHGKMLVEPRIAKLNCPYVTKLSNNIK